jgi:hypothetical protein
MSSTTRAITSASVKALLNGEKVEVRRSRFLCMTFDTFSLGDNNKRLGRAKRNYAKAKPATYFVEEVNVESPPKLHGMVVFTVPEDYIGYHVDYDLEKPKYQAVGTLMKMDTKDRGVVWKIETDLEEIERERRKGEVAKMRQGRMSIGQHGKDADSYMDSLVKRDLASETGMATRGHGLSF